MDDHQDISEIIIENNRNLKDFTTELNGIVLIFMPDTHGISSRVQLKNLRNDYHKISGLGWDIIVITSESQEIVSESSDDLSLPFIIQHDIDNTFARAFNTLGSRFDNPFISERTKRRTYILDNKLNPIHVIDNIHPDTHAAEIIELLIPEGIQPSQSIPRSIQGVSSEK